MPNFRSARPYITAYDFKHLMLLAGVVESRAARRVHTAARLSKTPASNIKCLKSYAVIHGLALLKMGIMMPETC